MTSTHTIIIQALLGLIAIGNQLSSIVPDKYKAIVTGVIAATALVQARLAHNWNPDGTKAETAFVAKLLILFLLLSGTAMAQNAPTPLFSTSAQAVAVHAGGQTVPGTDVVGSFNLTPHWLLQSHNILAPSINLQRYTGGVKTYPSFLSKPLAKTSLANIQPCIEVDAGIVRNVPSTGPASQHYSFGAYGCFDYKVNNTLSLGPRAGWINTPGFGPHPNGYLVSANITVVLAKLVGK